MSGPASGFRGALVYWGPLAVWLGAIFYFSTDAGSMQHTSRIVEPLVRFFVPDASPGTLYAVHIAVRKTAHVTVYGLLALVAFRAFRGGRAENWRSGWAVRAFVLATAYALIDEYHQTFTLNRSGDVFDVLTDMAGALAALAILAWWRRPASESAGTRDPEASARL